MLSASRSIVAISSTVGKAENSSGFWIHSATIRISTESAIENASPMSIRIAGIGRNRTVRMKTIANAKPTSWPDLPTRGRAIECRCNGHARSSRSSSRSREARQRSLRENAGSCVCRPLCTGIERARADRRVTRKPMTSWMWLRHSVIPAVLVLVQRDAPETTWQAENAS